MLIKFEDLAWGLQKITLIKLKNGILHNILQQQHVGRSAGGAFELFGKYTMFYCSELYCVAVVFIGK